MVFVVVIVLIVAVVGLVLVTRRGTVHDTKEVASDREGSRAVAEEEELAAGVQQHRDGDFGADRPTSDAESEVLRERREGEI